MPIKVSSREKKILIAGAAAAVLAGLLYFGDQLVPSGGQRATLDQKKRMLAQFRETAAQESNYKARLEYDKRRYEQAHTRLLTGESPAIAGAELRKILSDLASQSGVEITRSDNPQPVKMQNDLIKIEVKIETNCNPEQLVQFIAAVENYERFLTLSDLTVTGYRMQKKYEIRPSVTVAGYILAPEAKPEPKAEPKAPPKAG